MPITSGSYARPANGFSNPVFGANISPTDAASTLGDYDTAINELVKGTGKVVTVNANTSTIALDLSAARHFVINLQTSVTTTTLSNWPNLGALARVTIELRNTGAFSFAHPASVKWPSGTAPNNTIGNGKIDMFVYLSADGGTTQTGHTLGLNFV